MIDVEEDKILTLKGTSYATLNYAHLIQQSDTLSSSLLRHAHFGNTNYDSIMIMRQKGIKGIPTIPRKLAPCDSCILGKHSKRAFHSYASRASRKLGLIH